MRALRQTAEAGPASAESDCFPEIRFTDVQQIANVLADRIEARFEELARVLLTYESFEVVRDETDRTIDLLRSLHENETYFERRIGEVVAFLPRNQPLYAFTCFVVVPALMASSVHFRIPHAMRHFFPELLRVLGVERLLSNIVVSPLGRTEFLRERSALRRGLARAESYPVTDAVIFTGTPAHADQLRRVFDPRTLFITNGAGHNPLIVAPDADIFAAVDAVIALQFYNQGQDCAAPNAILVHATVLPRFLSLLREGVRQLVVGPYENRACRIGPIGDPADLIRIQKLLVDNRRWLDRSTPGIVRAAEATAEPTIVCRPLREGPNFTELFAPIVVVQGYEHDGELARYFEHPRYAANAMYLSLYGASRYVDELIGRKVDGRVLHDHSSVLRNTHLHAAGVERGTQPYGGSGVGASSLRIGRTLLCRPTLPQRDLWEWIAKPLRCKELRIARTKNLTHALIEYRDNIPKLLRLKDLNPQPQPTAHYIDTHLLTRSERRFTRAPRGTVYALRQKANRLTQGSITPEEQRFLCALREGLLAGAARTTPEEFRSWLYDLASQAGAADRLKNQRACFRATYRLLFGRPSGPPLAAFLRDADTAEICSLLAI